MSAARKTGCGGAFKIAYAEKYGPHSQSQLFCSIGSHYHHCVVRWAMSSSSPGWLYDRTARDGILIFLPILALLAALKELACCESSILYIGEFMSALLEVALITTSAALGALLGINFQRHENEKERNAQSGQSHKPDVSGVDGALESETNATVILTIKQFLRRSFQTYGIAICDALASRVLMPHTRHYCLPSR